MAGTLLHQGVRMRDRHRPRTIRGTHLYLHGENLAVYTGNDLGGTHSEEGRKARQRLTDMREANHIMLVKGLRQGWYGLSMIWVEDGLGWSGVKWNGIDMEWSWVGMRWCGIGLVHGGVRIGLCGVVWGSGGLGWTWVRAGWGWNGLVCGEGGVRWGLGG